MMNAEKVLSEIADRMCGQNKYATKYPIYTVRKINKVFGISDDFDYDGSCYTNSDSDIEFDDLDELKDFLVSEDGENFRFSDFEETHYINSYETVQFFFSEKSAEEYINANKHYGEYKIYVCSAHDNPELKAIIELLNSFTVEIEQ